MAENQLDIRMDNSKIATALQLASTRQITAALQHLQRPAEDFIEFLEP